MSRIAVPLGVVTLASLLGPGFNPAQLVAPQTTGPTGIVVGVEIEPASGKPVADATVALTHRAPGSLAPGALVPQAVMTDPAGRFAFTGLPGGSLLIRATKAGYVTDAYLNLDLRDGERDTNAIVFLAKFASISGRVTDDLGDPVVDVTVRAHRRVYYAGRARLDYGVTGRTDDRGIYRIASLSPGDYVVAVPTTQVTVPVAVTTDYMSPDTVTRREAYFAFTDVSSSISVLGSTSAQRVGNLVLQSPLGTYYSPDPADPRRGTAYQTTFAPSTPVPSAATTVTVQSGEQRTDVDVQLTLVSAVSVSGSVAALGDPGLRTALRLVLQSGEFPDEREFAWATTVADAMGAFTFLNVPAGQYTLRATRRNPSGAELAPDVPCWAEESLTVGTTPIDGMRVTLRHLLAMTGQMKFEGTGSPSADDFARIQRQVFLVTADVRVPGVITTLTVDSSGSFATQLTGGRHLMTSPPSAWPWTLKSATWQGRDISRTPIEVTDRDISGVVVTLTDRPARIAGTVRNAQGVPDKAASVLLFPVDVKAWVDFGYFPSRFLSVATTITGAYVFARVPADDYFLVAATERTDPATAASAFDVPGSLRDWLNPAFLAAVSRVAVRVHVADAQAVAQDLKTTVIR